MFRRVTLFILILTTLTANCYRFFIFAGFQLNKKYISENICINKARPWMHCNGKCYFIKKIKQAEENEKKQEAKDNLNRLEVSFFQESFRVCFIQPTLLTTQNTAFPSYSYQYSSQYIDTVFRPPKQAA